MTELVVIFRNFANAPKKNALCDTVSASLSAVNISEQTIWTGSLIITQPTNALIVCHLF